MVWVKRKIDGETPIADYTYDALGRRTRKKITGRRFDPETSNATTQMYFYRARYYSPVLGRFISRDPIDYAGGMDLYEYVEGMAVDAVDPMGLQVSTSGPSSGPATRPKIPAHAEIDESGVSGEVTLAQAGYVVKWLIPWQPWKTFDTSIEFRPHKQVGKDKLDKFSVSCPPTHRGRSLTSSREVRYLNESESPSLTRWTKWLDYQVGEDIIWPSSKAKKKYDIDSLSLPSMNWVQKYGAVVAYQRAIRTRRHKIQLTRRRGVHLVCTYEKPGCPPIRLRLLRESWEATYEGVIEEKEYGTRKRIGKVVSYTKPKRRPLPPGSMWTPYPVWA